MEKQKSVLIIDDDTVTWNLLARLVEKAGAKPICVQDGRQAERMIASGRGFDLVMLDLLIPFVSGWDLLNAIRKQPATMTVPVVVFTGTDLSEEERTQILGKAQEIANKKDFSVDGFMKLLGRWL